MADPDEGADADLPLVQRARLGLGGPRLLGVRPVRTLVRFICSNCFHASLVDAKLMELSDDDVLGALEITSLPKSPPPPIPLTEGKSDAE